MYEIIRIEAAKDGKPRYAVINHTEQTLCEFSYLWHAAAFVRYVSGGEVNDGEILLIENSIHRFYKKCKTATNKGG